MITNIIYYKFIYFSHNNIMKTKNLHYYLTFSLFIFFILSILSIYTAKNFVSVDNVVVKQIIFFGIGLILLYIGYRFKEEIIKYAFLWYIGLNILLLFLLIFGISVNGSKCWIFIGPFSFQPSEFMKLSLIILLAKIADTYKKKKQNFKNEVNFLFKIFLILSIPSILTFLEPDTGVVIIYFIIAISIIFIHGINKKWYIFISLILISLISTVALLYFFNRDLLINILGSNIFYRIERILNWSSQTGYQLENSLVVIASSGLVGFGINNIPLYFPEATTDFIFTTYTSMFGFIGTIFLLLIILLFDSILIKLTKLRIKRIDKYILSGVCGMIIYQQFQNIGMTIGLLPITGITLPFISYGGSSLLSYMFISGIILNIIVKRNSTINSTNQFF